jgi:hypothetical protein
MNTDEYGVQFPDLLEIYLGDDKESRINMPKAFAYLHWLTNGNHHYPPAMIVSTIHTMMEDFMKTDTLEL